MNRDLAHWLLIALMLGTIGVACGGGKAAAVGNAVKTSASPSASASAEQDGDGQVRARVENQNQKAQLESYRSKVSQQAQAISQSIDNVQPLAANPGAVALLVLLFVIGSMHRLEEQSGSIPPPSSTASASTAPEQKGITYRVEGTAERVLVTYTTNQGGMQQDEVIPPWEQEYPDMGFGKSAALSVTKKSENGTVTCKIIRDGKEWRTSTSSAACGSASCSGIVGT